MNGAHYLAAVISSTPPPKHMRARDSSGKAMSKEDLAALPKEISLDRLVDACKKKGIDVHQVIAEALSPEMRLDEKSGMNMREQARMAWQIIDKAEPSKKSLDLDANIKGDLTIGIVSFASVTAEQLEAAPVPTDDVAGA